MDRTSLTLSVPPDQVRDVQLLMTLEADGFLPPSSVTYSEAMRAFVVVLTGERASHILELLAIAADSRDAETWHERQARERDQIPLEFVPAEPYL